MGLLGQMFGLSGKGTLLVTVDKPYYISGELITGTLQVNVLEPIECTEILVIVSGKEKVYWTEQHTVTRDGQSHQETRVYSSSKEFFKQKLVLCNVEHHISPGNFIYPFQYQLPPGLPGCYDNEKHEGVKAKIEFSIKGTLGINGMFTRDLKHRQRLTVYAQLAGVVAPSIAEKLQTVRLFCCISQGQCKLHVEMDKNMYGPGEIPVINCRIENNSKKDIRCMRSELVRTVTVHAMGRTRVMRRVICQASFPGVPAGQAVAQPQPFQLTGNGMYPSTQSSLIQCTYCIEVVCDIAWCPDVTLYLPIALGAPVLVPVVQQPH